MNITVTRDVPYGRRPAQRLDIHHRPGVQRAPVLVLVHGGAWAAGDKANADFIGAKAAHWAARGWVVVSVNYRLPPWGGPAEQAEDVAKALAAVHAHIARWGGDAGRICVLGHSTGAHLVALVLAGAACPPVQGAVLLDSAAFDVVQLMHGPHLPLHERAFGSDPAAWERLSPWHQLLAAPPPLLLVCSALRPAAQAQGEHFAAKVHALGGQARLLMLGMSHAELNHRVGEPGVLTDEITAFLDACTAPGKPRRGPDPANF